MINKRLGDLVFITVENPAEDLRVKGLINGLNQSLEAITGASGSKNARLTDFDGPKSLFVIGLRNDIPVACGGLRPLSPDSFQTKSKTLETKSETSQDKSETCEIKRMFAIEKGKGVGKQILAEIEERALSLGYKNIQLETRRINQVAVNFYLRNGYVIIDNYGIYQERPEAVCFAKKLF